MSKSATNKISYKKYDPNRRPFARGVVIEPFAAKFQVHPLQRQTLESYFRSSNPEGFWHDLGAQDVFLDNFGMLFQEQFDTASWPQYVRVCKILLMRWQILRWQVIQSKPFWGKHINAKSRKANSGEPRPLLRFMRDEDWSRLRGSELPQWWTGLPNEKYEDDAALSRWQTPDVLDFFFEFPFRTISPSSDGILPFRLYDDWPGEALLLQRPELLESPSQAHFPDGVISRNSILTDRFVQKASYIERARLRK